MLIDVIFVAIVAVSIIIAVLAFSLNAKTLNNWINSHIGCTGGCHQGRYECDPGCKYKPN